jgi:hypothetical protein
MLWGTAVVNSQDHLETLPFARTSHNCVRLNTQVLPFDSAKLALLKQTQTAMDNDAHYCADLREPNQAQDRRDK